MKVCIVGCGAVGGIFAAHLARLDGVKVWGYDVNREHVDAMNRNGLRVSGAADFIVRVKAATDPTQMPRCDYGIVATKAIHTGQAIAQAARIFDEHSAVCSV